MTYAMCGFANFGSLGIMVGGMETRVPERRSDIVALEFKSILIGTLAACVIGVTVGCFRKTWRQLVNLNGRSMT